MKKLVIATLVLSVVTGAASAQVTFENMGSVFALDISADGSVIVGNLPGVYETFRWTEETGAVALGGDTGSIGVGAGTPDVSDDGTSVSATIIDETGTLATQGVWTTSSGWQELMPPTPPDGGTLDSAYGSMWGLSGDGLTAVGLYWRPGNVETGLAHASKWTAETGVVDLGSNGADSRANDANYDGSVIVGWAGDNDFGFWWPTVWVDGVMTILTETVSWAQAKAVTPDGTMVVGSSWEVPNEPWHSAVAAAWRWNGSIWEEELLWALPGTASPNGVAVARDVTADGSMVVGYNQFSSPFDATGFIWTAASGIIDIEDFLTDHGIALDPDYDILDLTGVTDDGSRMVGIGQSLLPPYDYSSFIIDVCRSTEGGHDGDGDGDVDARDFGLLQQCFTGSDAGPLSSGCAPFDTDCDLDVDLTDYAEFLKAVTGPQ